MESLRKIRNSIEIATNTIASKLKSMFSGEKNVDCVFVVGPNEKDLVDDLRRLAQSQALSYAVIGDGEHQITEEMITNARRAGVLGQDTEVFSNTHGGFFRGNAGKQHGLELDADSDLVSPEEYLSCFRKPLENNHYSDLEPRSWKGNIHLTACHVGQFRSEFKPSGIGENELWEQGHVFLHGSKKMLYTGSALGDVETVIREIGVSKRLDGTRPSSLQIMRALMERQSDSVTLLGKDLSAPLVLQAPQSVMDVMSGNLQAQWLREKTESKLQVLDGRVSGPDQHREALMNTHAVSTKGSVKLKSAANIVFTRIVHVKNKNKLDRLFEDLKALPGLLNLSDKSGITPLILVASLPRDKTLKVRRHDLARELISRGADINAKDKQGRSAIHYAALTGDLEMFDTLLSLGAKVTSADRHGNSVFHFLTSSPSRLSIPILQRLQALPDKPKINAKNKQGFTALKLASDGVSNSGKVDQALIDALKKFEGVEKLQLS